MPDTNPGPATPALPRTALLHDYLLQRGGAERVAMQIARMLPRAELFTSAHNRQMVPVEDWGGRVWRTSPLQAVASRSEGRALLPLFPLAFSSFDLTRFDLLVSSTSGFAHHARKREGAVHVAYCHTPPRFLWRQEEYFRGRDALRKSLAPILRLLQRKDLEAARRVDVYIAVSRHVAHRIRRVYGRPSLVVHPPVDCGRFRPSTERSGRFLVVSRLIPGKRIDLVIEAANRMGLPLDVVGAGPDEVRLRRLAGPSVRFLGRLCDEEVAEAMARCTAVVVAGEEDFGLVTAEAQAAGRPPVAFAGSGAPEIVEDGVTGYLFEEASVDAVAAAMMRARDGTVAAGDLVDSARRFDVPVFRGELGRALADVLASRPQVASCIGATMALDGTRA